jgi:hypothetical protein
MEAVGSGGGGVEATEDEQVMSEVHLGCPPGFSGLHVSRFTFSSLPIGISSVPVPSPCGHFVAHLTCIAFWCRPR